MWEIRGNKIPNKDSPFHADFLTQLKQLGFENMTDEVAITTKTKEKYYFKILICHLYFCKVILFKISFNNGCIARSSTNCTFIWKI